MLVATSDIMTLLSAIFHSFRKERRFAVTCKNRYDPSPATGDWRGSSSMVFSVDVHNLRDIERTFEPVQCQLILLT